MEAADFLAPKGELEPSLFPKEDAAALHARLQTYIEQATALVDARTPALDPVDEVAATAAYVYWRAYDAVLLRFANTPNTSLPDQGSVQISGAQIAEIRGKRDDHRSTYEAIMIVTTSRVRDPGTVAVRIVSTF